MLKCYFMRKHESEISSYINWNKLKSKLEALLLCSVFYAINDRFLFNIKTQIYQIVENHTNIKHW